MTTTLDPVSEAATADAKRHSRRWWVLAIAGFAQLMVVLDATIVNIALPRAQEGLGFDDSGRQWVVTAYALAFGGLLLLGGRIGDVIGRRNAFIIGILGFGGASAVGGAATGFAVLVGARAGQGAFGALLAPAALGLVTVTFTEAKERATAFGIFGAIAGGGGAVGLILGGVLTDQLSWRWCLYVNLIITVPVLLAAFLFLVKDRPAVRPSIDIPGAVVVTAGLVGVVYGFANAESNGWSDLNTGLWIAIGTVLLAVFVVIERRVAHPLMPLHVLTDRNRGGALLCMLLVGAGIFAIFLFLTFYLQLTLGFSATKTGVSFLPMVGGLMVAAQVAGPLLTRVGARPIVPIGMLFAAIGLGLFTRLDLNSSYAADILPGLVITGLGMGLIFAPCIQTAVSGLGGQDATVGSALITTMQQIGGSIGVAVFSTIAATAATDYVAGAKPGPMTQALAAIESYTTVFAWTAGLFVVGAVIAALILRSGPLEPSPDGTPVLAH